MSSVLSLSRSEYSVVWLPLELLADASMAAADEPKHDSLCSTAGTRDRIAMSRFLVAFCIGLIAVLAWQSYSDAARQLVETSSSHGLVHNAHATPDMTGPASIAAPFLAKQAAPQDSASQQEIKTGVEQLASAQDQITRDFDSLQQIRHTISKISVAATRPVPGDARKYALRSATATAGAGPSAHHTVISSTRFGSSSRSLVVSMRLDTGRKRTRSSALRSSAARPFSQSLISASQRLMSAYSKITGVQL